MRPFDVDIYRRLRAAPDGGVGSVVYYREVTGSTMDDARAGAESLGAESGAHVYVAGEQTSGRGRQGRQWLSGAGAGLYATFHLCPPRPERAALIGVAGALAVADAVSETSGIATQFKWPNDVMIRGRKLAGLLAEVVHGPRIDVFLGIGINVRAVRLPGELAQLATSIEREGAPPPGLESLLASLSAALERRVATLAEDPQAVLAAWQARLVTLGQRVRLATPAGEVEGDAVGVTEGGELLLAHADGSRVAYAAGDVTTLR